MLIDYCNNGDYWWPKLFHVWSEIIWHLPPTMPCFNPKGVTTNPFKCRGLARLRSSCTREREREKKSLSDFCPLLNFVYLCHLFICWSGHQRSAESCENQSQNTWKYSGRLTKSLEEKNNNNKIKWRKFCCVQ